jgi:hypothetical protein
MGGIDHVRPDILGTAVHVELFMDGGHGASSSGDPL